MRVKRRDDVVLAPDLVDRLVEDLVHDLTRWHAIGAELPPRRRRWPEEICDEREESHQQQRGYESMVVIAAAQPEHKADKDRERGMHEVETHRGQGLHRER